MQYFVELAGREHKVEVARRPDGLWSVRVGERELVVSEVSFGPRACMLNVDGRVLDMTLEGSAPQLGVVASGLRSYVKVESERQRMAARASGPAGGAKQREVRSPMPGRIVKVLVSPGDEVAAGQALVVVEAMKMENDVRAKSDGRVARVHVSAGATVEGNAVLVSFEV